MTSASCLSFGFLILLRSALRGDEANFLSFEGFKSFNLTTQLFGDNVNTGGLLMTSARTCDREVSQRESGSRRAL